MFWNVRAMPAAAISCGARPASVRPSNSKLPLSVEYTPVSTLKSVVLPAPFGPMRP